MSVPAATTCVVHLVRRFNGTDALRAFLESYARHPAGMPHALLLVFKGFVQPLPAEYEQIVGGVVHSRRFIPDQGFDIDTYFETAKACQAHWICFMNSYSVILADDWLAKMHRALIDNDAGAVGATGSRQSILSKILGDLLLPQSFYASYPAWKRVLLAWFPSLLRFWRIYMRWTMRGRFSPFPNHHLRTNAFLIPLDIAARANVPVMRKKFDAYAFESGNKGLTTQILGMDKRVLVVGRDGKAYDIDQWHLSNTFWRKNQENLLVADNQTRRYESADLEARAVFSTLAWGPDADPQIQGRSPLQRCS